jgi:hypothetical protein
VANEKGHSSGSLQPKDKLSSYGLDEIDYWLYTSREKFDVSKFCSAVGVKDEDYYDCTITSRDPASDYSMHVMMFADEEQEVTIQLSYSRREAARKTRGKQVGPYVEEFGEWLGQFFKYETTQGHMHGHFSYPLASRQSKFLLPLKTNIEDAEIDGVSLNLPTKPEGVIRVRLTQGKRNWLVEVIADRRISFKDFTPHADVRALASVINTLLEERKS